PANIMLTEQGHVKVMDFGLAKRIEELSSPDVATREIGGQLTANGVIVGTPDYMSPEQVKGLPIDTRSDLFSFGAMLVEMATGRHPFRQRSTMETFSAVLREPPVLTGDIPPRLTPLLERLLAKEVGDRYQSMADVRADLAQVAAAPDSVAAPQPAVPARSWRWPAAVAIGGAVIVGLFLIARAGIWRPAAGAPVANAPAAIRSIAVLPLDNYSGDPNQDYFAEGMTDELTTDLATIGQLRVISRGSAVQFKGKARPSTPEIARILNVDAVVEGSVVR